MTLYVGSNKIKDTGAYGVYLGSQNTNCLTKTPKNINLELTYGAWTQPVLTANGTWGGDSFATKTKNNNSAAYKAFDSSNTSYVGLNTGADNELYFYNPQPLKISKIDFTYYPSTWIINGELYGSNDDSNYVKLATIAHSANTGSITVNNTTGYKYFKIKAISAKGSDGFSEKITDFYHIAITATALNTLVLKKGSKVYVPNGKNADGSNKFDEVTVASDLTIRYTWDDKLFVYVRKDGAGLLLSSASKTVSGTTDSLSGVTYHNWYDTNNNVIHRYTDDTSTSAYFCSFPVCIATTSGGAISNIDQVFDWCGYIGTAIFRLPDVIYNKGDGLNNDGTYKITKYTSSSVVVREQTYNVNGTLIDWGNKLEVLDSKGLLEVEDALPTAQEGIWERCYVKSENKWYSHSNTSLTWNEIPSAINKIADCSIDVSTNTVTLTPYTAQPEMTVIPIKEIYNGSQKVYQYNSYQPSTVIVSQAGDNTSRTIKLGKGVYEIVITGGGGFGKFGAYNYAFYGQGGSGASIYGAIYIPEDTTITYYAGMDNQSASSSAYGYSSYIAIGGTQILTASGGQSGWDFGNHGKGGTATNNLSVSKIENLSLTFANGVAGGSGGISVDPDGTWGEGGRAGNLASDRGEVGRVYIKYVRYAK